MAYARRLADQGNRSRAAGGCTAPVHHVGVLAGGASAMEAARHAFESRGRPRHLPQQARPVKRWRTIPAPCPLSGRRSHPRPCATSSRSKPTSPPPRNGAGNRFRLNGTRPRSTTGNHRTIIGPDHRLRWPLNTHKLDYELELACIIGREGIDITERDGAYIAGYTIMNDLSARDIQFQEMACRLGPAKGKTSPRHRSLHRRRLTNS